jgi:hypothetical protein
MIRKLTIEVHSNGWVLTREDDTIGTHSTVFEMTHRAEMLALFDNLSVIIPDYEITPCPRD